MKKLAWKIAFATALLVIFVIASISIPVYWQTRYALEEQLASYLENNLKQFAKELDYNLLSVLYQFPQLISVTDSLRTVFENARVNYLANTIYLFKSNGTLLISAGDQHNAAKSILLHTTEIEQAEGGDIVISPLFSDPEGNRYKSAFMSIHLPDGPFVILGMNASADFLKSTERLRSQIFGAGIIVLIISILLALILSKTLTSPLSRLSHMAASIGKGQKGLPKLIQRKDEIGFLGSTLEKMQNQIAQREKENKQLIASVAHEIKNPLGGMKLNTELLLEDIDPASESAGFARAIHREVTHLSQIIESFLAYSRPIESNLVDTEIAVLVEQAVTEVQRERPKSRFELSGNAVCRVHPGKIKQALFNMLKNAAEASPDGASVELHITDRPESISISILNSGAPIPEEIRYQIFDAFFTTKELGVGLGLSISKSIVEQHGGSIQLAQSDADGTKFVINIPK